MPKKRKSQLEIIVEFYIRHGRNHGVVNQDELDSIVEAVKDKVLKDALLEIEHQKLEDAEKKARMEYKAYKRKLIHNLKISLIAETLFLALLVGVIVNQITYLVPESYWWQTILISSVLCLFIVILATAEPKE